MVGAGHAGIEAALASARRGAKTAIFTIKLESVGTLSCNPSIGGPAKGHLAKEIDALGGELGYCADLSGIHFRMLNKKKGPAVWAPRSQNDRRLYSTHMQRSIEAQENLSLIEATITDILVKDDQVYGLRSQIGTQYFAPKVILAMGTFLKGTLHVGKSVVSGGRSGEPASIELSASLRALGFKLLRFKTGTPPRVDMRSLDYHLLEEQAGDDEPSGYSFYRDVKLQNRASCYITRTTPHTHQLISQNISLSSLYGGMIEGIGARYCPSIEDKIVKFPSRDSHQVFIEPEGLYTHEGYVNGISTSLPAELQEQIVHSIPGLGKARIMRYAYAIEYDCIPSSEIDSSLASKRIKGLYLAGQINGTSGYEEAAAQGLMAGINASLSLENKEPLILGRSQAYIGVLVDDLVTKGTNEPYRMFTSRAEYRLMLRQDNADERLMELGYGLGLVSQQRYQSFCQMQACKEREMQRLKSLKSKDSIPFATLLKRPEISFADLKDHGYVASNDLTQDLASRIELAIKYEGYLARAQLELDRFNSSEDIVLPPELDYLNIPTLATEAREKLAKIRPRNLAQALRVPGVNYTDASALMIWLRKHPH